MQHSMLDIVLDYRVPLDVVLNLIFIAAGLSLSLSLRPVCQ